MQDLVVAVGEIEIVDLDHAAFGFRLRSRRWLIDGER